MVHARISGLPKFLLVQRFYSALEEQNIRGKENLNQDVLLKAMLRQGLCSGRKISFLYASKCSFHNTHAQVPVEPWGQDGQKQKLFCFWKAHSLYKARGSSGSLNTRVSYNSMPCFVLSLKSATNETRHTNISSHLFKDRAHSCSLDSSPH